MSSTIWTQCAGESRLEPLRLSPWRIVESQHHVATRKLVDSLEEQELLEELIEAAKPPAPRGRRLHFLLTTPFRYPPLEHGSRFASRSEPSLYYGSESLRTAFAELAYYRLVFLEGSAADLDGVSTWHTAFTARVFTERGIDLASAPFDAHRRSIASPTRYEAAQALGAAMREAKVEAFRFPSARDAAGINVGVFVPKVFTSSNPHGLESWHVTSSRQRVECVRRNFFDTESYTFDRQTFLVGGMLPAPAF